MKTKLEVIAILFFLSASSFADEWVIDFSHHQAGPYTSIMSYIDFKRDPKKNSLPNSEISFDTTLNKNILRLKYPKGCLGTSKERGCAAQFHYHIAEQHDTLWLAYKVLFEKGFDFRQGGKLPGLCGGKCYTGGKNPSDGNGWSARIMWRENVAAEQYVYHSNQKGKYGDSFPWSTDSAQVKFKTGKWHYIVTKIKLNNIDKGIITSNGTIETWFDGEKVLYLDNVMLRKNPSVHISELYFSTFHGGGTDNWSPRNDSYARFSDIIIRTDSITTDYSP